MANDAGLRGKTIEKGTGSGHRPGVNIAEMWGKGGKGVTLHNRMGALNASYALLWIRLSLCDLKPVFLNLGGNLQSSTHCIAITGLRCVAINGRRHTMY